MITYKHELHVCCGRRANGIEGGQGKGLGNRALGGVDSWGGASEMNGSLWTCSTATKGH